MLRRPLPFAAALLAGLCLVHVATGKIHNLVIVDDGRASFVIEHFGFAAQGKISLGVSAERRDGEN